MNHNICDDINVLGMQIVNNVENNTATDTELNIIFSSLLDIKNSMTDCMSTVNEYLDNNTNSSFNKIMFNDSTKLKKKYIIINILKLLSILATLVIISIMYYKNKK